MAAVMTAPSITPGCEDAQTRCHLSHHESHLAVRMSRRAAAPGTPISSSRSNLPGRLNAGSRASGLLVAATTTSPSPPDEGEREESGQTRQTSVLDTLLHQTHFYT